VFETEEFLFFRTFLEKNIELQHIFSAIAVLSNFRKKSAIPVANDRLVLILRGKVSASLDLSWEKK